MQPFELNPTKHLLVKIKEKRQKSESLSPFSVFHCYQEQKIHRVPIINPTLIFVLKGEKRIGLQAECQCVAGELIYIAGGQNVFLHNLPDKGEYLALTLELKPEDFSSVGNLGISKSDYFTAPIDEVLALSLEQQLQWVSIATEADISIRRAELVSLLARRGYSELLIPEIKPSFSQQVIQMIQRSPAASFSVAEVCKRLATSEASLRRRLRSEDTSFTELLDSVRMGLALELVQTSALPIGLIAERCGYQSVSRFSERFKLRFEVSPSGLRKTQQTKN